MRWKVTTPAFQAPPRLVHAMRSSGRCSVISAIHSFSLPPMTAFHCRRLSSSWRTSLTPSMNFGKSSNCVPWLSTARSGPFTSIDCSMAAIGPPLPVAPAAAVLAPQRLERRNLCGARLAPRRPEVDDDEALAVLFEGRHAAIEPRQPQRRRAVPLAQLADAGALERIERRHVRPVMAAVDPGPPDRQRPHEAADQRHRQHRAHELLAPPGTEQRTRRPAFHRRARWYRASSAGFARAILLWGEARSSAPSGARRLSEGGRSPPPH